MEKKILQEIHYKCAQEHTKVKKNFNIVQECEFEADTLFAYCIRWPNATKKIKDLMDFVESQLNTTSRTYSFVKDKDKSIYNSINTHSEKLFILQQQKKFISS